MKDTLTYIITRTHASTCIHRFLYSKMTSKIPEKAMQTASQIKQTTVQFVMKLFFSFSSIVKLCSLSLKPVYDSELF